ncbi:hypothetical protein A0H81_13380 [Grifola frondosa]|uniref:Uncharacterized protein n=1 Tax=Grifola frondosa TaxID=5627 RepID=A0A1C7LP82_GRIFR|nr:hypothetical protein A0H81_13380 [Grifola frondosa]
MGSLFSRGFDPAKDIGDLSGKVVIVTGGNAGIGFSAIQHLARRGAKVYMAARNEQKAKAAIERLHKEGLAPGNGKVVWLDLDLNDPRTVKMSAAAFLEKEERLDILINNAALLLVPFAKSHDDIQDIVMVNYIGHFVFTRKLLPLMAKTAKEPNSDVRIVTVSSDGHQSVPDGVHFRNIDDFNVDFKDAKFPQFSRYIYTKLMDILFAKQLQRRIDAEGAPIISIAICPGTVNTDGVQTYAHSVGPVLSPIYSFIANAFFTSPSKGGGRDVPRGIPSPPGRLARPSKQAQSEELARELWDTTEKVLQDIGV